MTPPDMMRTSFERHILEEWGIPPECHANFPNLQRGLQNENKYADTRVQRKWALWQAAYTAGLDAGLQHAEGSAE